MAYVPQSSWMRNATLRENVIFGQRDDEKKLCIHSFLCHPKMLNCLCRRFSEVIRACRLERDLDMLPHREQTEIGEKGINLSGASFEPLCSVTVSLAQRPSRTQEDRRYMQTHGKQVV